MRLRQLMALALARSGATENALTVLERLRSESHADEETLGLIAGLHKDRALESLDPKRRESELVLAHEAYLTAHRQTGGYWTGVNAATLALLRGRGDEARALAQQVAGAGRAALARAEAEGQDTYWVLATLGETALLEGHIDDALRHYARAGAVGTGRLGDLSSTRRNARLICTHLGLSSSTVDTCFQVPAVAVCAGHLVDRPGRPRPRFPPELEPAVAAALRGRIRESGSCIGYASAACGTDILFLEEMLALGGEIRVVLPYEAERFVADSVEIVPGTRWRERFFRVLSRAAEVTIASDQGSAGDHASYDYVNRLLLGLARDRASRLETPLVPLVVWDGRHSATAGGTASAYALWEAAGSRPEVIDVGTLRGDTSDDPTTANANPREGDGGQLGADGVRNVAILFADAVEFGKLTEDRIPDFVNRFLGSVGALAEEAHPLFSNTWGDGLVFMFATVAEAGSFALDLAERVAAVRAGQPSDQPLPSLRIGLHAGPVYELVDPVTLRNSFFGTHITRAARIEPITPPGHVYGSQAFAALAWISTERKRVTRGG